MKSTGARSNAMLYSEFPYPAISFCWNTRTGAERKYRDGCGALGSNGEGASAHPAFVHADL
jgi:hypothetical protein